MFECRSILLALLGGIVLTTQAGPVVNRDNLIRLPLVKKVNVTSATQILKEDQARAVNFVSQKAPSAGNVPATNRGSFYSTTITVGSLNMPYTLLIDTGSSNTWVGAEAPYVRTSTSIPTGNNVSVTYGSGFFEGTEYLDTVKLTPALSIKNQSIGAAEQSQGFTGIDGIMGLGPDDLTIGTLSPDKTAVVPTLTDNLYTQGEIPAREVSIFFQPLSLLSASTGELTFGGIDASKISGPVTYVPITSTFPSSAYWGIDLSTSYGSKPILTQASGIVDTGTTLILIETGAFNNYKTMTGAVQDENTGLLRITMAQFSNLKSLFFTTCIGDATFELIPDAQVWPRDLNTALGGSPFDLYLVVADLGDIGSSGLDFILGYTWLERFYSVYDTGNRRVGIANTPYTKEVTNSGALGGIL